MQETEANTYDYIIAGAGCAGLSLLYAILQEPQLKQKQILLIDKDLKKDNDRTWCFWQKEKSDFEEIVCHKWSNLKFESSLHSSTFNINPYEYKMIKGIDFYNFVFKLAQQHTNVTFINENITSIQVTNTKGFVTTDKNTIKATYIFNSTNLLYNLEQPMLLQHFMGWEIQTKNACFNDNLATFMDFTVPQTNGTTFMYVLPTSPTKALVEFTLFTKEVLAKNEYENALKLYIQQKLGVAEYEVLHQEYGVIPMTKQKFAAHHDQKIINIGTAAGCVKASSGYTFSFIQKHTKAIISKLLSSQIPIVSASLMQRRFQLYDNTLLEVLLQNKMKGDEVFAHIFKAMKPQIVLAFLDNDSSLLQEIGIMSSVPTSVFLPTAFKEMFR